MKLKTSCFSGTLFRNTVKRFWPLFAAYLAIWIIVLPLSLNSTLKWAELYGNQSVALTAEQNVLRMGATAAPVIAAIFGLLFAMAAFSYLYSSRSVSMICSLPIKREGVFLSVFTTGLVGMLVSNILVFLGAILVQSAHGVTDVSPLMQWLGMACLNCLFFYGFAAFCASLTGHILILPCVYAVLNFVVVVVEYFVRSTICGICYGMSSQTTPSLGILSPFYNLVFENHVAEDYITDATGAYTVLGYSYDNWTTLIVYGIIGLAFALLAMLLIKNRRMETAGDVVAVKPLRPIFKYCMAFGCALVLGVIINYVIFSSSNYSSYGGSDVLILVTCMLVGAFIGYFAADMLMRKTLRVFEGRNWIGYAVTCAVVIALMLSCEFDLFGFERKVLEASEVESVKMYGSFDMVSLEDPENIQAVTDLHKSIISNKKIYENIAVRDDSDPDRTYGKYPVSTRIIYNLKNGKTIERYYNIFFGLTDDCDALSEIINSDEAVQDRKRLALDVTAENVTYASIDYYNAETAQYESYSLSPEQAVELFSTAIVPDIESKALGNIWLDDYYSKVNGKSYYDEVYACNITIEVSERVKTGDYNSDYFNTTVTVSADKTLAWLTEHGIVPMLQKDLPQEDSGTIDTYAQKYVS